MKKPGYIADRQGATAIAVVQTLAAFMRGHIERSAEAEAEGARAAGAAADIKRVPELVPHAVAQAAYYKLDQIAPIAQIDDLLAYEEGREFARLAVPSKDLS